MTNTHSITQNTSSASPVFVIAVAGGSGSGKTTVSKKIVAALGGEANCQILSQDSYYVDQSARFHGDGSVNFDHPSAIDFDLMAKQLQQIKQGQTVSVPIYDFVTHTRSSQNFQTFTPHRVVIVDGILILSQPHLRRFFDESLFLNVPEHLRFARRLKRDTEERGRTPEGVKIQFYSGVKPMHDEFVEPSKIFATRIVESSDADIQKNIQDIVNSLKKEITL